MYNPSPSSREQKSPREAGSLWHNVKLGCGFGFIMTVLVFVVHGANPFDFLLAPDWYLFAFALSFMIYAAIAFATVNLVRHPSAASVIILLIVFSIPAASWIYDAKVALDERIAGHIRGYNLTALPQTYVPTTLKDRGLITCCDIKSASLPFDYLVGRWGATDCRHRNQDVRLTDEYILLDKYDPGESVPPSKLSLITPSIQLRYVTPTQNKLLAYDYQLIVPYPSFPPVLTPRGWYHQPEKLLTVEEEVAREINFMKDGIHESLRRDKK